jgi:hypothetical protein
VSPAREVHLETQGSCTRRQPAKVRQTEGAFVGPQPFGMLLSSARHQHEPLNQAELLCYNVGGLRRRRRSAAPTSHKCRVSLHARFARSGSRSVASACTCAFFRITVMPSVARLIVPGRDV